MYEDSHQGTDLRKEIRNLSKITVHTCLVPIILTRFRSKWVVSVRYKRFVSRLCFTRFLYQRPLSHTSFHTMRSPLHFIALSCVVGAYGSVGPTGNLYIGNRVISPDGWNRSYVPRSFRLVRGLDRIVLGPCWLVLRLAHSHSLDRTLSV